MKKILSFKNLLIVILRVIFLSSLVGCGAVSTSGRYETKNSEGSKTNTQIVEADKDYSNYEQFDLAPYRPKIELENTDFITGLASQNLDAWYEYDDKTDLIVNKKIVGTEDGFRVQIIVTDDLDEANRVNTEIISLVPNHRSYVIFDPPFYKVKLGDFIDNSDANNMRFRLSQLGYTESKIVRETINVFE